MNKDSYVKYNGKIGETKEIYPRIQVTFDTIVIFNDSKHGKVARKCIQTVYLYTGNNESLLNSAYDEFVKHCERSVEDGRYVEGMDIKIR